MSDYWLHYFDGAPKRTLDAGETLFRRGDQVEWAFFVRVGRISLRRALKDGGLLTLHAAWPNDLVAEASLFARCYHCDAIAEAPTTVSLVSKVDLIGYLENSAKSDRLSVKAFERTARELQNLRTRIEIMRMRKVTDRLDAYLELYGSPEAGRWVHVADWIGVSPPALYRELAERRTKKLISLD
ncbi:Crp/Fnr family transcriptional regulator [Ruegeria sp. HKCCD6428]|uniref:Crp/Fnr family transcriptional regulator n=1 Tax=Ruegeria sp. HKCCD6428 TaxID=2683002 RepID=UPI001492599D|nr:Crp/Fnr family transcriptional regulator [Ruegeria sp. HKCCD6428]NOC83860.1 cyclic nucleotide-binding domain-containing protein [Ruegeria sp. HKCCD6428]